MAISLKIKGNKLTNEGFGIDHVVIGNPAFFVIDQKLLPGINVNDLVIIRHYDDKSVFTWMRSNVFAADSNRADGVLAVAVSVPRGEWVRDLFGLLRELLDHYIANYMEQHGNSLKFTHRLEQPEEFRSILSRYHVEPYPYRHIVMKPEPDTVAYLYLDWNDIASVLDDPMRQEFAQYGQVVLVPYPDPTMSTFNIEPVMKRLYTVVLNGERTSAKIDDPDRPVNITLPATPELQSASVSFTLNNVRQGQNSGAEVIIDDFNQIVTVNIHQKPIERKPVFQGPPAITPRSGSGFPRWAMLSVFGGIALLGLLFAFYFLVMRNNQPGDNDREKTEDLVSDNTTDIQSETIFEEKLAEEGLGSEGETAETEPVEANDAENSSSKSKTSSDSADKPVANDKANEKSAEAAPEWYSNVIKQLTGVTFSRSDLEYARGFVDQPDITDKQRARLQNLIDLHQRVIDTCKLINAKGAEATKTALSNLNITQSPALANYIKKLVALDNDKFEEKVSKISRNNKSQDYLYPKL